MDGEVLAAALVALTGVAFLAVALHSLRPTSGVRKWYGVDPDADDAVRSNAAVVAACGVGLVALAAAVAVGVPERVVGTATVAASAALCVGLGWVIRYRDRRDLLTVRDVDRETAERLGAAAMLCGLAVAPLAPVIWFRAGPAVVVGVALGGTVVGVLAVAAAFR